MSKSEMNIRASFLLGDLGAVGDTIKVELIRTGSFTDPRYGDFDITENMLSEMVKNFSRKVRGVIPALDYSHESDGVAAGWFKNLWTEKNTSGGISLMAEIAPTPKAAKMLADKEFGYISADFDYDYQDNETREKYGCVLLGAGLTNRPVIKRMEPVVQLAEKDPLSAKIAKLVKEGHSQDQAVAIAYSMQRAGKLNEQGDGTMTPEQEKVMADYKKLQEAMKCADPDQLYQMIMDLQKKVADLEAQAALDNGPADQQPKAMAELRKQLSESKSKLEKFEQDKAKSEKEAEFQKMLTEFKAVEAQREPFMAGDFKKFAELAQPLNTKAAGQGGAGNGGKADPQDEVLERATKLSEQAKIPMKDAISQVLAEDKELAAKVNK